MTTIILVEDDKDLGKLLHRFLTTKGHQIHYYEDPKELLRQDKSLKKYDFALIDYKLPNTDGITVIRNIKKRNPHICSFLISGYLEKEVVQEAEKEGIISLVKPFDLESLLEQYIEPPKTPIMRNKTTILFEKEKDASLKQILLGKMSNDEGQYSLITTKTIEEVIDLAPIGDLVLLRNPNVLDLYTYLDAQSSFASNPKVVIATKDIGNKEFLSLYLKGKIHNIIQEKEKEQSYEVMKAIAQVFLFEKLLKVFSKKKPQEESYIYLITGKRGAGKTTLQKLLMRQYHLPNLEPMITVTMRPKGRYEKNGKDHYFIAQEEFFKEKHEGKFLFTYRFGTYHYAIPNIYATKGIDYLIATPSAELQSWLYRQFPDHIRKFHIYNQ